MLEAYIFGQTVGLLIGLALVYVIGMWILIPKRKPKREKVRRRVQKHGRDYDF